MLSYQRELEPTEMMDLSGNLRELEIRAKQLRNLSSGNKSYEIPKERIQ